MEAHLYVPRGKMSLQTGHKYGLNLFLDSNILHLRFYSAQINKHNMF